MTFNSRPTTVLIIALSEDIASKRAKPAQFIEVILTSPYFSTCVSSESMFLVSFIDSNPLIFTSNLKLVSDFYYSLKF